MSLASLSNKAVPRVAICGSGVAGPVLGAILSRQLGSRIELELFERAPQDSDQGYGLDLDAHGQEALVRAGVYDRYWDISVPRSDVMLFYDGKGNKRGSMFQPRLFQALWPSTFGARPETNRGGIRDICLDMLETHQQGGIRFEKPVKDLRRVSTQNGGTAIELLGEGGTSLGEYDFVVDSMGWNSSLRRHRVRDEGYNTKYDGTIMIHGSYDDPQSSWPAEMLANLGTAGTIVVFSECTFAFQRYGCGPGDRRTSFMMFLPYSKDPDSIFGEIGIAKPISRKSSIMVGEDCDKVKAFVHQMLGDNVHPMYHASIDALDRATVRPSFSHGGEVHLKDDCDLPLVCIGDALSNCGVGGGGILAMQDTIELAKVLARQDAFDDNGSVNLKLIREVEPAMLERKENFRKQRRTEDDSMMQRPNLDNGCFAGVFSHMNVVMPTGKDASLVKRVGLSGLRFCIAGVVAGIASITRRCKPVGSDASNARLYSNVKKALEEESKKHQFQKETEEDSNDEDRSSQSSR